VTADSQAPSCTTEQKGGFRQLFNDGDQVLVAGRQPTAVPRSNRDGVLSSNPSLDSSTSGWLPLTVVVRNCGSNLGSSSPRGSVPRSIYVPNSKGGGLARLDHRRRVLCGVRSSAGASSSAQSHQPDAMTHGAERDAGPVRRAPASRYSRKLAPQRHRLCPSQPALAVDWRRGYDVVRLGRRHRPGDLQHRLMLRCR
jgi:hypothetical protein